MNTVTSTNASNGVELVALLATNTPDSDFEADVRAARDATLLESPARHAD